MDLLFATSNKHKVSEANKVGRKFGVRFRQINVKYPEVRDNSVSKVALDGIRFVYPKVKRPVVVEDSGLFIKALNNFPGSYSRYVFDRVGVQGILNLMRLKKDRNAFFTSVVAYSNGKSFRVFEGVVEGTITKTPMGSSGFGFDPIFIPKGFDKTFAEEPSLKEMVSHRSRAFERLCKWLA